MVPHAEIPRFIVGLDGTGSEFVACFAGPVFVARVADTDEDGSPIHPDEDADVLSGVTYTGEGFTLCQVVLIDGDPAEVSALLREAGAMVEALR